MLKSLQQLHSIATRFAQDPDFLTLLSETLDVAIYIARANKAAIHLMDPVSGKLKLMASKGFSEEFLDHFSICPKSEGVCEIIWDANERLVIEDIKQSPILIEASDLKSLLQENIHSIISTKLKDRTGNFLGILTTYYTQARVSESFDMPMLDVLVRLLSDLIEREQWAKERAKWLELLHESDRRKNNFLAILSHELRNPLASVSNSSFMLANAAPGSDSSLRAQATIDRQLKQMTRLIDDLLDISRITQNKIQLRRKKIDVNELVRCTAEDNASVFESLGIDLQISLSQTPVMINADSTRIEQVISNLLQNASKFSKQGGTTHISVAIEEKSQQAIICVKDDGVGIDPDLLEHLFEPFMQADRSLDHSNGGLGLGLTLVKSFIELHNGNVSVVSKGVNQGAEFIIRLPLDQTVSDTNVKVEIKPEKSFIERCVLIIEDNIHVADSLRMVLEMFGHIIHISHNGADGIQKAKNIKPDFVICDVGLPEMDGYQVAKMLRADNSFKRMNLIALSGYAQSEDIEKSRAAGFDLHMSKPPNLSLLKQLLEGGIPAGQ